MEVRRRQLIALATLVACGHHGLSSEAMSTDAAFGGPPIDAPADAPADAYCSPPPGVPECAAACGNGQIETCFWRYTHNSYCVVQTRTEACEVGIGPSCAEIGFYGDGQACEGCLQVSAAACEACSPTDLMCASVGFFDPSAIAASDRLLGMIQTTTAGAGPRILIVDPPSTIIANGPYWGNPDVRAIVGVQNGWLVARATPHELFTLDAAGNIGPSKPIDTDEPAMARGPSGRVVVAWSEGSLGQYTTYFEIVDANGGIVFPKTLLFAGGTYHRPAAGSDGRSFFVGASGVLATIRSNGAYSVTTGFPNFGTNRVQVTWDGNAGWYVAMDNVGSYVAQRFDATGAPIGSVITVGLGDDFLADGNDLLVVRYESPKLRLVRIDANGSSISDQEVGAGGRGRIVRARGAVYVVWWWLKLYIAQVAP
jgi:hypothetical protein